MAVSSTEIITNRYHIFSLLQRACASHAIVSLCRPHEQFIYNSAILSINNDMHYFTLDTPAENQIPLQAKTGDWLKLRIKLHGLVMSFDAVIEDILGDDIATRRYQLQLPSQVNYQQRRGAFRANIGYQFQTTFSALVHETRRITGRVTNLSLGGLGVEVAPAVIPELKPQTSLNHCTLHLAGDDITITSALIKTIQISEHSLDIYRLGIEFVDLTATERRHLQRWITKFDRENRKSARHE